tara:strand:- start:521 stop:763 length:243 start_codon:yes stop_codon:yes gene_type:complete
MKLQTDFKSLGWREMHPMQVEALMNLIANAIALSQSSEEPGEIPAGFSEIMIQDCDDLVRLFGGKGLEVHFESSAIDIKV